MSILSLFFVIFYVYLYSKACIRINVMLFPVKGNEIHFFAEKQMGILITFLNKLSLKQTRVLLHQLVKTYQNLD